MGEGASDHRTAPVDAGAAHAANSASVDLPDRWRLIELLGSGGQATVWLAEDRTLGQRVALKILPADADERTRGRWLEEVRQGRRLSHPHLIRIFDVVETSDRPVAVMEYVSGGTLADRVVAGGALPIEDVLRWTGEVLEVLDYLHDDRIVHRDVKPSNLLLTEGGGIKLSDLGLVRSLDRGSDLTRTLEGVGTPRFMSPEQLRGEEPTPACDLYSLGITMYQLLTGRLPFDGDSAYQIADGHLHSRPVGVREHRPECPRWLARFVEKLLEKSPGDRFRSARRALAALDGRWVGLSRRGWRLAAGLAAAAVISVASVAVVRSMTGPELDRIENQGADVVARGENGRRLWTVTRPDSRPFALMTDIVGGGDSEVVVGWSSRFPADDEAESVVFDVFSASGKTVRSIRTSGWGKIWFPEVNPVWHLSTMTVGNLVGDGNDLVWGLTNPRWYPCLLGASSVRGTSERPYLQLANTGHVQNLADNDLDGNGLDEIVAVMINNRLGYQRALVTMSATSRVTGEACGEMVSPDLAAFRRGALPVPVGCLTYTPLGSNALVVDPPRLVDGQIELVLNGAVRRFDVWGNPEDSLLYGSGTRLRESFWRDLASDCSRLRLDREVSPPYTLEGLRSAHPEVLTEGPTEVAAALVVSRSLASGGRRDNAIAVLRDGVERFPDERDLQLRLGELLLIGGDRSEGREWLARSTTTATSGRNHHDQALMLILEASVRGDRAAYDETRRFLANLAVQVEVPELHFLDAAWFFFQGEWSDPRVADIDPGTVHQWVRLIRGWARFERDRDIEQAKGVSDSLVGVNETRDLATVFEARVWLAQGDPVAAAQRADAALQSLRARCRVEFEACVWVPLAERVLGEALLSVDGRREDAEAVLARAAEHAPGTWIATSLTQ